MGKDKLVELAERCEAATGPDREIDGAICKALGWNVWDRKDGKPWEAQSTERGWFKMPLFTASLDAAMTLVPEGTELHIEVKKSNIWAFVGAPVRAAKAATPALALCAAALRSHAPK